MKYFKRIAQNLDVRPALEEIASKGSDLWSMNMGQGRENVARGYRGNANPEGTRIINYERFHEYRATSALLAAALEKLPPAVTMERARVRLLPPNSKMKAHRDTLLANARRYQVCLLADPVAYFQIKSEKCRFQAGDLWLCDIGDRLHFVDNPSHLPRIVLVIDGYV